MVLHTEGSVIILFSYDFYMMIFVFSYFRSSKLLLNGWTIVFIWGKKKRGTASCKYILEESKGNYQTKLLTTIFNLSTLLVVHS